MVDLLLFSLKNFGLRRTIDSFLNFIHWWLLIGRKYKQDWRLGSLLFNNIRNERIVEFDGKYVFLSANPPFPSPAFNNMMFPQEPRSADVNRITLYPSFANVGITGHCSLNCWHCSAAGKIDQGGDLSTSTWKNIFKQVQDAGLYYIGITGGEPLMRRDLEEIVSNIDARTSLALATSGMGLTYDRAVALKQAGIFYMFVSLDHYQPEVHDRLRGMKGAFDIAVNAMHTSIEARLYTIMQTAITKKLVKQEEIWKLADLGRQIGVQEIRCRGIVPAGKLIAIERSNLLTEEEQNKLVEIVGEINKHLDYPKISLFEDFERASRFGCNAGSMHVYIDYMGNLCPCDYVALGFGNLQHETFDNAWLRMRTSLGIPQRHCLACHAADAIMVNHLSIPVSVEESQKICRGFRSQDLPDIYIG